VSAAGRTSWYGNDAEWHLRDLQLEMGDRFGAGGISAMGVLWAWAQAQSGSSVGRGGRAMIKNSYRRLEREAYLEEGQARELVAYAVEIGALLDFEEHENGRRFTAEVAEFATDQVRAQETFKKRAQRSGPPETQGIDAACPPVKGHVPESVATEGLVPEHAPNAGLVPVGGDVSPLSDQIIDNGINTSLVEPAAREAGKGQQSSDQPRVDPGPDARRLCRLLADLILQRDPQARVQPDGKRWLDAMRLLIADRGGDAQLVERVLRWSQQDPFWQTNVLSPTKLREKFSELHQKSQRPAGPGRAAPGQHIQRHDPDTCPGVNADAQQVWEAATESLVSVVTQQTYDIWLSGLHAHRDDGQVLVLGGDPDTISYVSTRWGQAIATAVGRGIKFEACDSGQTGMAVAA
jgi:hypothetical protein